MQENKRYTAIGMMSGTSMDGLDAAMIKTDGKDFVEVIDSFIIPYDPAFHSVLKLAIKEKNYEKLETLEDVITRMHILSVKNLLAKTGIDRKNVDVIGMHGQTVFHAPDKNETKQIGDGQMLADATGISVVNDFRKADVMAGGQGAPLVPVYHLALSAKLEKPIAFLNIGGVANITWINNNGQFLACDTGTGNALLNDWIHDRTGKLYDDEGKIAASGTPNKIIVDKLLEHKFFKKLPPKSLDRGTFNVSLLDNLSLEDGAATLVEFTVEGICRIVKMLPKKPNKWFVCGGGRYNKHIMKRLNELLDDKVYSMEDIGFNGGTLEAEAFGYMAVRNLLDLPISFPGTTGVSEDMCGGVLSLPKP